MRAIKACTTKARKARLRFENEANLLQECKHENIVPLIDADLSWATRGYSFESSFYVMELAKASLDKYSDERRNVIPTLDLFRQACRAIMFLHERDPRVLHRDIKPSNLLVAIEGGRLMVTDFGIATEEVRQGELTASKEVVGSLVYRAPEVSQGQRASVRSDVFSLGKVLERILTNAHPDQARPRPIPAGGLSDGAREHLDRVIAKATAWDPIHRYGSVKELLEAIPELKVSLVGDDALRADDSEGDEDVLERLTTYLRDERKELQLRELVNDVTEKLYQKIADLKAFPLKDFEITGERILDRLRKYDELSLNLVNVLVVGTIFENEKHARLWVQSIDRVLDLESGDGYTFWVNLRYYPGLLLYYAAGLGALSEGRYELLNAVFTTPVVHNGDESEPAATGLIPLKVFQHTRMSIVPAWGGKSLPLNEHILEVLRSGELSRQVPSDRRFDELFDRFEYYRAMVFADAKDNSVVPGFVPLGRYARYARGGRSVWLPKVIDEEIERFQSDWPPLQGGMFGGDLVRAREAQQVVSAFAIKQGWGY